MNSIEKIRIIPKLEIKNQFLIKGMQFEGLAKIGDPIEFAKKYFSNGADQIFIQDIVASLYSRNNLFDVVKEISQNIFIPITVGGGIRNIDDIKMLLKCGADRVSINTKVISDINFIKEINKIFGNQFLTISIEVRKIDNQFFCMTNHGRDKSNYKIDKWLNIINELEVGEVMITSIDSDGSCNGFDKELVKEIQKYKFNFPLVYGGGINSMENVHELLSKYNFSGINVAAALHNNNLDIKNLKNYLHTKNHNVNLL